MNTITHGNLLRMCNEYNYAFDDMVIKEYNT